MQNSTAIVNTTITYYTSVPLSESVDSVDQNLTSITNSTKADSIDSVLTDSLSNVIPSWQFSSTSNSSANTTAKKNPAAQNTISSEPISSGYLQESVDDTNKLSALSISTWVKPDYSQGSPEFTVISKYNSFILSINNIIPATQVAKFSIFNGIKWYTVQSVTQIPQQWTHLVSTFNGTAICMYVNEKAESCNPLPETIISIRGDLTTTRLNNLTSDSNVVIGAYVNPIRESVSNQFNGLVDSVLLYNSTLQPSQVTEIFNENKQKYLDHNDQDALNFSQP